MAYREGGEWNYAIKPPNTDGQYAQELTEDVVVPILNYAFFVIQTEMMIGGVSGGGPKFRVGTNTPKYAGSGTGAAGRGSIKTGKWWNPYTWGNKVRFKTKPPKVVPDGTKLIDPIDDLVKVADEALESGQNQGAATELTLKTGEKIYAVSGENVPPNKEMTGVLSGVSREGAKTPWCGNCSEVKAIEKALNAKKDVTGAKSRTVQIGESPNANRVHGKYKPACKSCEKMLDHFKIKEAKSE